MSGFSRRPGPAVIALMAILVITVGWWALALWPAGADPPDWLVRTRAACFGTGASGLPNAGGWLALVGQPLGMLGFLLVAWGDSLRGELTRLGRSPGWRVAGVGAGLALGAGGVLVVARVMRAEVRSDPAPPRGVVSRMDRPVPDIELIDQRGERVRLTGLGRPFLLTFGYGHCVTVCPTSVRDLLKARRLAGSGREPVLVVTLDPWRDTPERLSALATAWGFAGEGSDRVLSGTPADVERVLDQLDIARRRDPVTGDLDHIATVLGVNAQGRIQWRLDGGWGGIPDWLSEPAR